MTKIPHYNVMLVEDEILLGKSLARHISAINMGFKVTTQCSNGSEALKTLKSRNIHLIITDILMPVMNGLELAKAVSEQYPYIKMIILSGHAEFEYAKEALRYGASDYLLKPLDSIQLEEALNNVKLELSKKYKLEEDYALLGHNALQIVEYASKYFREHYMDNIDLSTFSQELGFSSAYLTKLFNKYKGCTPSKYLADLRINYARQLLLNSDLPIRQIGEKVGYLDQFHFSKMFRKATGLSPSAFRNQANAAKEEEK